MSLNSEAQEKYERTILEMARGIVVGNGAGLIGIIALMQGQKPVPAGLVAVGLFFMLGLFSGASGWGMLAMEIAPNRPNQTPNTWVGGGIATFLGTILFVFGVLGAFIWAVYN